MTPLPLLLASDKEPAHVPDLNQLNVTALRTWAKFWQVLDDPKMGRSECVAALKHAFKDDQTAKAALASLSPEHREVLAVYRRYGGLVDGTIARLELLTRDLVRIKETGHGHWT